MLAAAVREAGADVIAVATATTTSPSSVRILDRYAADVRSDHHQRRRQRGRLRGGQRRVRPRRRPGSGIRQGGDATGDAAGHRRVGVAGSGPRSSRCPATRSARWCPSRCSSVPRCARAMGLPEPERPRRKRPLAEALTSPPGKRQFRARILDAATGTVTSYGPPASHHLRWLASANCLLDIPEDVVEVPAGTQAAGLGSELTCGRIDRPGRRLPRLRKMTAWHDAPAALGRASSEPRLSARNMYWSWCARPCRRCTRPG